MENNEHSYENPKEKKNQCPTTVETFALQIGRSVDEILNFYHDDLSFSYKYSSYKFSSDPYRWLDRQRQSALNELEEISKSTNTQVEAVIIDRYENFDWDKWLKEGASNPVDIDIDNSLLHAESLTLIKEQGAKPATMWPLLCFGYQHREYFKKLKYSPQWLIAPEAITKTSNYLENICYAKFGDRKLPQVLKALINNFGPGRICYLREELLKRRGVIICISDPIIIPQNLSIDDVDEFAERENLTHIQIEGATVINPAAVDTSYRGALIHGYGEPSYPRVLGIRSK